MATTNPNYDVIEEIRREAETAFEYASLSALFTTQSLSPGKRKWSRRVAKVPKEPVMYEEIGDFAEAFEDRFGLDPASFHVPRHFERIWMSEDEYSQLQSDGVMPANIKALGYAMARGVDKRLFQNPPATHPLHEKYWGAKDVGTGDGTYTRPLICPAPATATNWVTANQAMKDLGGLAGCFWMAELANMGEPILFYPQNAKPVLKQPNLVTGAVDGYIRDLADRQFRNLIPTNVDDDGNDILTGDAELTTDFELTAMIPEAFVLMYDKPPELKIHHDAVAKKWYVDYEVHAGLAPASWARAGGKIYKAIARIDTIVGHA